MFQAESRRDDGIDFVVIATPNHLHLPVAEAALAAGIAVMSDKPATATYEEVLKLQAVVAKAGLPYGLTHTYAGYSLVREARALCASGKLGPIRKVAVEYLQGWLSRPLETTGHKQAAWRSDPAQNGPGGCIGDIGTHAFHLTEYVTGLEGSATGTLIATQIAAGERNQVRLRVYGENGSLDWHQEDPNTLSVKWLDGPEELRHAGGGYLGADALAVTRLPGGHPEGYIEAFAVLYREFADALTAWKAGNPAPLPATLPGIEAGVRGMRFIERTIESDRLSSWVEF
jgi:predicted dehydrogenase